MRAWVCVRILNISRSLIFFENLKKQGNLVKANVAGTPARQQPQSIGELALIELIYGTTNKCT